VLPQRLFFLRVASFALYGSAHAAARSSCLLIAALFNTSNRAPLVVFALWLSLYRATFVTLLLAPANPRCLLSLFGDDAPGVSLLASARLAPFKKKKKKKTDFICAPILASICTRY
jgi:hypothetical protein